MAWMIQAEEFGNAGGAKADNGFMPNLRAWSNDLHFGDTPEKLTKKLSSCLGNRGSFFKSKKKRPSLSLSRGLLGEIGKLCRRLNECLRKRQPINYKSPIESRTALTALLDCSVRLCQYLLHAHGFSSSNYLEEIYDFLINMLSRPEFDHACVHTLSQSADGSLNDLGIQYFQFCLNCLKLAISRSYSGQNVESQFAARTFARLMFKLPLVAGHVVDCFPTTLLARFKRTYRSSTYSHFAATRIVEHGSPFEIGKNSRRKRVDSKESAATEIVEKIRKYDHFISQNPDLFAWASFSRFAESTRLAFESGHKEHRSRPWNHNLKNSPTFCLTFIREYVQSVVDVAVGTSICWDQLPLYNFLADATTLFFRSQLQHAKRKLRGGSKEESDYKKDVAYAKNRPEPLFHHYFDGMFFKELLTTIGRFISFDDGVGNALLNLQLRYFSLVDPLLLEMGVDTFSVFFKMSSNRVSGYLLMSKKLKSIISQMVNHNNISIACHGIFAAVEAASNTSDESRVEFIRWFLTDHFFALFLHWSSMVRGFFHHFLMYNCFRLRRRLLPLSSDRLILILASKLSGERAHEDKDIVELDFPPPKMGHIARIQDLVPEDLAILSKLDGYVNITLRGIEAEAGTAREKAACEGATDTLFLSAKRRKYITLSSSEYAKVIRQGIRYQEDKKTKGSMFAPPPPDINLSAVRRLLHGSKQ